MDRHLRHRAQRALRCFASALASNDPKAHAEAWGWTPQMLHELVDKMYPSPVDSREVKGGVMNAERVMEVLRRVEWFGRGLSTDLCPWCRYQRGVDYLERWYGEGHADGCKLAALLREGEKPKPKVVEDPWLAALVRRAKVEALRAERKGKAEYIKALEAVVRTAWRWTRSSPTAQAMAEFREALGMVERARKKYWEAVTDKEER